MTSTVIQQLAERLRKSNPEDSHEQREIFERIRDLRSDFDASPDPEVQRYLEAASMLVAFLARMGGMAGPDVQAIAVRLMDGALEAGGIPAAPAKQTLAFRRIGQAGAPAPLPAPNPDPAQGAPQSATELVGEMMLGQILLQRGHILEEHVRQAMRVQRTTPARIGEILVKMGACTREQLTEALSHQASLRRVRESLHEQALQAAEPAERRALGLKLVGEALMGEILVERNVVTRRQLERALEAQKRTGVRVGDALVEMGATTADQIEQALHNQGRDRRFGGKSPAANKGQGESR